MNSGILTYFVFVGFSRENLEALDKNGLSPILTAAACKNYDALVPMDEKGGDSLKSTLFHAAKEQSQQNIKALEVVLNIC